MTWNTVVTNTTLGQNICAPADMHNGVTADFLKRYLIAKDQFWWDAKKSPWAINLIHEWAPVSVDPETGEHFEPYRVSYWRDRVLNLCEWEFTYKNFGLNFNDLMNLDPATFEDIEDRVHAMVKERDKQFNKEQKDATGKGSNLLKDLKR